MLELNWINIVRKKKELILYININIYIEYNTRYNCKQFYSVVLTCVNKKSTCENMSKNKKEWKKSDWLVRWANENT